MPGKRSLDLWQFIVVAPQVPDGSVEFNLAIEESVSESLRESDLDAWKSVLKFMDRKAREKIKDSLP